MKTKHKYILFLDRREQLFGIKRLLKKYNNSVLIFCASPYISLRLNDFNIEHKKIWEYVPHSLFDELSLDAEKLTNELCEYVNILPDFNKTIWQHIYKFFRCHLKNEFALNFIIENNNDSTYLVFPQSESSHNIFFNENFALIQGILKRIIKGNNLKFVNISSHMVYLYNFNQKKVFLRNKLRYLIKEKKYRLPSIDINLKSITKSDLVVFGGDNENNFMLPDKTLESIKMNFRVLNIDLLPSPNDDSQTVSLAMLKTSKVSLEKIRKNFVQLSEQYITKIISSHYPIRFYPHQIKYWYESLLFSYLKNEFLITEILTKAKPKVSISSMNFLGITEEYNLICNRLNIYRIGLNHGGHAFQWPDIFPDLDEIMTWGQDDINGINKIAQKRVIGNSSWKRLNEENFEKQRSDNLVLLTGHHEIDSFPVSLNFSLFEETIRHLIDYSKKNNKNLIIKSHPRFDLHRYYKSLSSKYPGIVKHISYEKSIEKIIREAICVISTNLPSTAQYQTMVLKKPLIILNYLDFPSDGGPFKSLATNYGIKLAELDKLDSVIDKLINREKYYFNIINEQNSYLAEKEYFSDGSHKIIKRLESLIVPEMEMR